MGLLVLLTVFFVITRPQPLVTFRLADGTQVEVASVEADTQFHMYHGSSMQRSLFKVVGTRLSPRMVGSESSIPATLTNGTGAGLAVVLRHFSAEGFIGSPWNGNQSVILFDPDGKEINGLQRLVHFDSDTVSETTKITREQILWEFPLSKERDLQFRLYATNTMTGLVSTNQFVLRNPRVLR
jgi:hypothetical protein